MSEASAPPEPALRRSAQILLSGELQTKGLQTKGLLLGGLLSAVLASGCDEPPPAPPPEPPAPQPVRSFALAAHEDGAVLAAAPTTTSAVRRLDVWLLDDRGALHRHHSVPLDGAPNEKAPSEDPAGDKAPSDRAPSDPVMIGGGGTVQALQAVSSGDRLTLAWQQYGAGAAMLHTGHVDLQSGAIERHGAVSSLVSEGKSRGLMQLQVQPSGAETLMFAQLQAPCSGEPGPCLELAFGVPGADSIPPRPRLAIPHPCERPIAAFSLSPQLWHYAVCSRASGVPTMTVFSAQPQPAYAQAQPLRPGCVGTGGTRLGERLLISALCRDDQHTLFIVEGVEAVRELVLRERSLHCRDGVLELHLDEMRHPLGRGDSGLARLLPDDVAPAGAQALWTGSTLLIAQAEGELLQLSALGCSHNLLTRRELPPLRGAAQDE